MGDEFKNIGSGTTIVNRSTLTNAMNRVEGNIGPDVADALKQIASFVEKSGNAEAVDNLNAFTEELQKPEPKKSLLRSLWNGLVSALPAISQLAEATAKIAALVA